MYLAGQPEGFGATDIFSASLAVEAPLSVTGWEPTRVSGRQNKDKQTIAYGNPFGTNEARNREAS